MRVEKRTNVVVDKDLVQSGLRLTGLKTQRELIDFALRELVRREGQKSILALRGRVQWSGDLEAMRQAREFKEEAQ